MQSTLPADNFAEQEKTPAWVDVYLYGHDRELIRVVRIPSADGIADVIWYGDRLFREVSARSYRECSAWYALNAEDAAKL